MLLYHQRPDSEYKVHEGLIIMTPDVNNEIQGARVTKSTDPTPQSQQLSQFNDNFKGSKGPSQQPPPNVISQ